MIKVNELRIGNLFYLVDRTREIHLPVYTPMRVEGISWNSVEFLTAVTPAYDSLGFRKSELRDITYIPLTEEWLLKFGFEKRHEAYFYSWRGIIDFAWDVQTGVDFSYEGAGIALPLNHIKAIHQLQNLIFALTGEELTIKE